MHVKNVTIINNNKKKFNVKKMNHNYSSNFLNSREHFWLK